MPRRQRLSRRSLLSIALGATLAACGSGTLRAVAGGPRPADDGTANRPLAAAGPPPAPAPVDLVWQADGSPDRLRWPTGLAVDRAGTVTVVDAGNHRLVRLSGAGQVLARLGNLGSHPNEFLLAPPPPPDGVGQGHFGLVGGGVAVDADGAIFVADSFNARVQQFDRAGRFVAAWRDLPPTAGQLIEPAGIAVDDRQGRVYVADRVAERIQVFDRDGRWRLAWGAPGRAAGQFLGPVAMAVDRQGRVYLADGGNDRIQVFDGDGRFLMAWGGPGRRSEEFTAPVGVAVDGLGQVYVATAHRVLVFTDTGIFLAAWGGAEVGVGLLTLGGIAVDDQGAIYVTDQLRVRVLKFVPRGGWPTPVAALPTPRPATPTPTLAPATSPTPWPFMTPTDR
jgi:DNA-binding beta-propeller fold protein YncE